MSNPVSEPREPVYAWLIVLLAAIAMAATLPGRTHGLGLVTKHLLTDFPQLSQQAFGRINLVATLLGAVFCLPCGWLLDRLGIRWMLAVTLAAISGIVVWMSCVRDLPSLIVAITLSRGVGQSMLSVISITMIGKWFQRRLGIAMGLYSVLMSLLMAASTIWLAGRIGRAGWRTGWFELGVALAIVTPFCAAFACSPWRSVAGARPHHEAPDEGGASATLLQALGSPCFWVFGLAISFFGLVSSGISLWQQLILEERNLPATVFRDVLAIGMLVGMLTNLTVGGLAQFVRLSYLLAVAMALLSLAYLILPLARTPAHAYAFAIVQGMGGGMLTVLFFAVWRTAYGPAKLGRIQGAAQMLTVFASALGPLIVAESNASAGTYANILYGFAGISALLAVAAALTPVPNASAGAWRSAGLDETALRTGESLA